MKKEESIESIENDIHKLILQYESINRCNRLQLATALMRVSMLYTNEVISDSSRPKAPHS